MLKDGSNREGEHLLLRTKLYVPQVQQSVVARPHLYQKLDDGQKTKLILISAPAGYGKTTLVTDWLSREGFSQNVLHCWLSLDEDDNDIYTFFSYLAAAVKPFLESFSELQNMLKSPSTLACKELVKAFLNDVDSIPEPLILVLDDYHVIESRDIDLAMDFLLKHIPTKVTLVLTSRTDPGFPIGKLRARGELTEVRVNELRFSEAETQEYFQESAKKSLSIQQVLALGERTEGWVAGLQLAALSMQGQGDIDVFLDRFTGSNRFVMDYLTDEVLAKVPPDVHSFLLKTSILNRLHVSLCSAVMEDEKHFEHNVLQRVQRTLHYLESTNLFLISLDERGEWYRYHHLFAELLQQRLLFEYIEEVEILHQRACRWFEEHNLISEALYHAHRLSGYGRATELIATHTRGRMERGLFNVVISWINNLPDTVIRKHPLLAIGKAWESLFLVQSLGFQQIESYLNSAEDALLQRDYGLESDNIRSEILTIRAYLTTLKGEPQRAVTLCREALNSQTADNLFAHTMLLFALGRALHGNEEIQGAIDAYTNGLHFSQQTGNLYLSMNAVYQLYELRMERGRLQEAIRCLRHLEKRYGQKEDIPSTSLLFAALSRVHYEQNHLQQAWELSEKALAAGAGERIASLLGHICQAQIQLARGQYEATKESIQKAEEAIQMRPHPEGITHLAKVRVMAALAKHDWSELKLWKQERTLQSAAFSIYTEGRMELVLARLQLAEHRQNTSVVSLEDTLHLLKQNEKGAAEREGRLMEAQMLQALAYDLQGNSNQAFACLNMALVLAETEGFVRMFVDEGAPMASLLSRMKEHSYAKQLLAGFSGGFSEQFQASSEQREHSPLVESLSEREVEILSLVAEGFKNKEIAAKLFISLNTVLYHTKNIYGKLGVHKRIQAVNRAKELRLI